MIFDYTKKRLTKPAPGAGWWDYAKPPVPVRTGSSAGTSDRILTFSSFANEARVLLSSPGMPNAAETIPRCELDRFHSTKRPKKIPLLQLADQSQSGCKSRKAPVPASTPFTSPLMTPSRSLQAEGRF